MNLANINIKDLACLIYETLKSNGINAVLVGGACVSIYTHNKYQSFDLDFVTYENLTLVETALAKLGFKRMGRFFTHEECPYLIDFVNPPVAIGNEAIQHFETISSPAGTLRLLTPTDCVKDRLSSFFHWNDTQALEQAILVSRSNSLNFKEIKRWAKAEGHQEKLQLFLKNV